MAMDGARANEAVDEQADQTHGGFDPALYAFAFEDLEWWTGVIGLH
jgi:MOSC domain-containing protein YiiM